jgi:hypothetical protein
MLVINYGKDWVKTTYDALAASDIGIYLKTVKSVSIKPNLVTPQNANNGATTHPEVVEGIIRFLKDNGIQKITIMENSAVGYNTKKAFKVNGYEILQKKYSVPLIDLSDDNIITVKSGDYDIRVCQTAIKAEFLINVPVLKAHCQTRLTCCMKNLKGWKKEDSILWEYIDPLQHSICLLRQVIVLLTGFAGICHLKRAAIRLSQTGSSRDATPLQWILTVPSLSGINLILLSI